MGLPKVDYFQLPIAHGRFSWTSPFGLRDRLHPNGHRGTDMAAPAGTPITAPAAGVVRRVAWSSCLGWYCVVEHAMPSGKGSVFIGHNHMRARAGVKVGQTVKRDQVLGAVGSTGSCTTGPHDHMTAGPSADSNVSGVVFDAREFIETHDQPTEPKPAKTPLGRKFATVASGDTLGRIAARQGYVGLTTILKLNPTITDPDKIHVGQKIRVK